MSEQVHHFTLAPTAYKPNADFRSDRHHRAKILVVEDDVHLMDGVREILELDGYTVTPASSGLAALKSLQTEPELPDLIISDIMMPQMNGYEFFEAVRSEEAWLGIPFIFLTARGEKSDVRVGKAMGADDYVTKPFGAEDLLVAVNSKLERTRQLQSVLSTQVSGIKRQILAMLNHEFRTPLTYVVAYADMLTRDADTMAIGEMRDFLKGVASGADRLRRLVENFIYLVELETGELEASYNYRKRPLEDLKGLVREAGKHVEAALTERKQTIITEFAPDLPGFIADREYLVIALARLLDNAIKFSKTGDQIKVSSYTDSRGYPTLAVTDVGRGIPEEELNRIFDAFYQVNRTKFEDQGAGSGLAIVRGIAQVHGAEISVKSAAGQGSTFALHFPPLPDVLN